MYQKMLRINPHCNYIYLFLFLILSFSSFGLGSIISSSELTSCTNTSSNMTSETTELDCQNKIVVSLSVNNGQEGTESLQYDLSSIEKEDGTVEKLAKAVTVKISKSEVRIAYPIYFKQHFNNKPKETTISMLMVNCKDTGSSPSCGYAEDTYGNRIDYSSGYCCSCSMLSHLSGNNDLRGGTDCSPYVAGLPILQTQGEAHCLSFDELWYGGFSIGTAETVFDIYLDVYYPSEDKENGYTHERLTIGPSSTWAKSSSGSILARYISSFAPHKSAANLEDQYLLIPYSPLTHERVVEGNADPGKWLLVDSSEVTLDGRDCNRVGVSYEAFAFESGKCGRSVGSCLFNQPDDFYKSGDHFLSSLGEFAAELNSDDDAKLMVKFESTSTSLITLEMVADNLQFVLNVAPGAIIYANISNFESSSDDGEMYVMVTNTGSIHADYQVTVNCSESINILEAQVASIGPLKTKVFEFEIRAETFSSTESNCTARLYAADATLLDEITVQFNTSETKFDPGAQNGLGSEQGTGDDGMDGGRGGAGGNCSWYDLWCTLQNSSAFSGLKTILIEIIIIVVVIKMISLALAYRKSRKAAKASKDVKKLKKKMDAMKEEKKSEAEKETLEKILQEHEKQTDIELNVIMSQNSMKETDNEKEKQRQRDKEKEHRRRKERERRRREEGRKETEEERKLRKEKERRRERDREKAKQRWESLTEAEKEERRRKRKEKERKEREAREGGRGGERRGEEGRERRREGDREKRREGGRERRRGERDESGERGRREGRNSPNKPGSQPHSPTTPSPPHEHVTFGDELITAIGPLHGHCERQRKRCADDPTESHVWSIRRALERGSTAFLNIDRKAIGYELLHSPGQYCALMGKLELVPKTHAQMLEMDSDEEDDDESYRYVFRVEKTQSQQILCRKGHTLALLSPPHPLPPVLCEVEMDHPTALRTVTFNRPKDSYYTLNTKVDLV
eukprot:GCRY01004257.1.p1 GENE.GCRY01004257.1~~GCRY01004257.1.p1  ORF type:complete len:967 (+),score=239.56 GCRY01004257.1:70-2970(+)